jgi:hypothetical protein
MRLGWRLHIQNLSGDSHCVFFAGAVGLISWQVPGVLFVIAPSATWSCCVFQIAGTACFLRSAVSNFHQVYYLYSTATYCLCWVVTKFRKPFSSQSHRIAAIGGK